MLLRQSHSRTDRQAETRTPAPRISALLRWFLSHTVRQAHELRKHVLRILAAQRDLLSRPALEAVGNSAANLDSVLRATSDKKAIGEAVDNLEEVANKWLKPYPHAGWRENVEVLLVAVAVAMGIRTFFIQPMKIPTGSMQPTLFGITYQNLKNDPTCQIPAGPHRWFESCFYGVSYYHIVAQESGTLRVLDETPQQLFPFVSRQRFLVGSKPYTIWFPGEQFFQKAGLYEGQSFQQGQDILKLKVTSGDHLFVNRLTYNFRHPRRGEIVIFETRGIEDIPQQDTFYIKRLIALGNDHVRIGNDNHVVINGRRLDANTLHFENVYTFGPLWHENQYFGHVNGEMMRRINPMAGTRYFRNDQEEYVVPPDHYMVMGDNTMNSSDSRYWGDFPREKVIGKAGFVYWPISSRFGWGQR